MEQNLSLYLHIPFCVRKCLYCDFLSGPQSAGVQEQYVEALCREIQETSPEYREYQVVSVFIGGGTPSVLLPEQTIRIMETLKSCFTLTDTCEISMEMNPGTVTPEKMNAYRTCGINRISIGLQSANDGELKALGRIHTCADFLKAYEMAVEAGFTNINVDLMSAIPEQTLKSYQETLQKVLALQPQPVHISAYSLIVEEGTPFYEQELNLPDEETERRMYEITDDILRKAGYHRYEISNYALPGRECRHNRVYWKRGNYVGFGLGAASMVENVRFENTRKMQEYLAEYAGVPGAEPVSADVAQGDMQQIFRGENVHPLSPQEQMEETMFLGLRLTEGVSKAEFHRQFGVSMEQIYGKVIQENIVQGLLADEAGYVRLTREGMDLSNYVMAQFLLDEV